MTSTQAGLASRAAESFTAYRAGDAQRMATLVEDVTPLLWHIARQQGLAQGLAEDAVQTAWLRLVEHADRIEDAQSVLKWLIVTTRREAWRLSKTARRDDAVEDLDAVDVPTASLQSPDATPEDALLAGEVSDVLWQHFTALPDRCRTLLRAVAFAEKPDYAAVAEALGMPVGSIGPTRGRCLAKLRVLLTADPRWEATA